MTIMSAIMSGGSFYSDDDIDEMRAARAAASPLADIANRLWGCAGGPSQHKEAVDEILGVVRNHIASEAAAKGWVLDGRTLAGMTELVAEAMYAQYEFTDEITRAIDRPAE